MRQFHLMLLFGSVLQTVNTRIDTTDEFCFEPHCTCNKKQKNATCTGLDYVPHVPQFVEEFELTHNNFSDVNFSRWFLSNITKNNIHKFKLIGNSIKYVEKDIFVDLISLKSLAITDEKHLNVTSLKDALNFVNTTRLKNINLYGNDWKLFPFDVFEAISLRKVTSISLEKNQLTEFVFPSWYTELKNLKRINLSKNNIIYLILDDNVKLLATKIDLSRNDIVRIPTFCNKMNKSKVPKLQNLILDGNAIPYLYPTSFRCLPALQSISLDANRLTVFRNNTFSELPQLKYVFFQSNNQLKTIEPTAFNSTSLISLHFGYNNFRFEKNKRFNAEHIFKHSPSLQHLDLTNNYMPSDKITPGLMFAHLTELKYLILQAVGLKELHPNFFRSLASLEKINLEGNFINSWTPETFASMRSIQYINLKNNLIHALNKSSLPENILQQLEQLDLANNPFTCTCDLMWFRNWIETTKVDLSPAFPRAYTCNFPAEMRGQLVIKYNPTPESCEQSDPFIVIAIILSSFAFLVIIVILLAYKGHTYIRNYCYILRLHRLRKQGYLRLNNSDDFEFHAFVVYCDADREWVHSEFIKRLEKEQIKLCVHHREFDPGVPITENIDKYMNKSWKVVIIMSNDFASSDWCQWECDYVQERRRRQGKYACVLIMLKAIDAYHMTSGIRSLLHTTPYLRYKKGIGEALFWQAVLNTLRRPLSVPPMAI